LKDENVSIVYSIEITLDVAYTSENIAKILELGQKKGFIYYDDILDNTSEKLHRINAPEAAKKIIENFNLQLEEGPAVLTILENSSSAHLWFNKNNDNGLDFSIGTFNCPRKKGSYIDFAYYIRMALDLCEDFSIFGVQTNMF